MIQAAEDNNYSEVREEAKGGFIISPKSIQKLIKEKQESGLNDHLAVKESYNLSTERQQENIQNIKAVNGKFNWSSIGELASTRPVVSKYSLSRYSLDEWRRHNETILDNGTVTESNTIDFNTQTAIKTGFGNVDKARNDNNKRLQQKAKEIFRWKVEVETACKAMAKEVELLEIERQRIKSASRVLMLPESITKECIELRTNRAENDLVADLLETELFKELKLVSEVRETLKVTLQKIEEQLSMNKAAKQKIEYDCCDKTLAYNTEIENLKLNPNSDIIMFKHGAVRYGDYTAPEEYYEFYCRESIMNVEAVRQSSVDLRSSLNSILINNGRKLRLQADKTDKELANTVAFTTELVTKLEEHLKYTLQSLADTEILIQNLHNSIMKMDRTMKLAQTRLDNRNNWRPHGENVKDKPHLGLLQEVKIIHENVTSLLGELEKGENARENLVIKRLEIEKEIASKKKTLNIDRVRCGMIRSHYPTASELAGL